MFAVMYTKKVKGKTLPVILQKETETEREAKEVVAKAVKFARNYNYVIETCDAATNTTTLRSILDANNPKMIFMVVPA